MLSLRTIPRNISHYFKQTTLELHTSVKLLSAKDSSSSSSSSDSSDSDSDKEVKAPKNEATDIPSTNERLNALLYKLSQKPQTVGQTSDVNKDKKINIAIKSNKIRFQKFKEPKSEKEKPFEDQLVEAAKDVAKTLGGDTQKTELELLSQVLNSKPEDVKDLVEKETTEKTPDLSNLLFSMKIDRSEVTAPVTYNDRRQQNASATKKRFDQPSVAESLLRLKSRNKGRLSRAPGSDVAELKVSHSPFGILTELNEQQDKNIVELTTWEKMEEREMKLAILSSPANIFQELILWTEQGKLWRFPINNEQGLEEEEKVHFSEHVFLDRHLKGWCPKKGPIRHFMELVCNGLSKNPYLTVEEKIGHIIWYKDYFEDKKSLLEDLGLLDNKPKTDDKKQIEA